MAIDWDRIRTEYITGQISLRALAREHGCSREWLTELSRRQEWPAQRQAFRQKAVALILRQAEQETATALILRIGRLILARFLKALAQDGLSLSPRDAERWAHILLDLEAAGEGKPRTGAESLDHLSDADLDAIIRSAEEEEPARSDTP